MADINQDLLKRFSKSTELIIKLIEDDSSDNTQVKILHLVQDVNAVGSIPTPEGGEMKVKGAKVYVAADDIEKLLGGCVEKDGVLIYNGPMHLDVSKPQGRNVNGAFTITRPAKIWVTSTKFSRRGGELRQKQTTNLSDMVNKMFAGGKTFDLGAETTAPAANGTSEPEVTKNKAEKAGA